MKESNLGALAYYKPGAGLQILRDNILGKEVFDKAFREYIKRWAYKHPTPDDFFRTMENVSGEDLSYFWRGWFLNRWKIDQAITNVSYVNGDHTKGSVFTVENVGKLPMPMELEIKFKDGSKEITKLPVEVWKRNTEWKFSLPTTKEISVVTIDPRKSLPDANTANNTFNFGAKSEKMNLKDYVGSFKSKETPLKFTLKEEGGQLMAQATGQEFFPLSYDGNNQFSFAIADIKVVFSKDKKSFDITQGGKTVSFTRE